jgi:hypothetical protein
MSVRARVVLCCVMVAAGLHATPTRATGHLPVLFPLASMDARVAAERATSRADAIIRSQACGQEPKFIKIRAELKDEEYEHQGEGFTNILIAKIQWLRTQAGPCEAKFVARAPEEENPVGSEQARLEAFMRSYFDNDRWRDPSVNCSAQTSQLSTSIVTQDKKRFYQLTATFRAERDCLRQQVNEAIRLMKQDRRMGTEASPVCLLSPSEDPGADFDMTVKEVVRILYLSGAAAGSNAILDADTIAHMYKKLLPARGGVGPATFNVISDCADTAGEALGTPEDYADRQDLGGDILEALEEAGEWLFNFAIKVIVLWVAIAVTGPLALAAWAGLYVAGLEDPLANLVNAPFDFRIPETENHRLMIESSRYLTNAAIIRHLTRKGGHDNLDEIREQQKEVREWLLKDLQRITLHDFDEYNSRPYTRLSLEAIQNLHDFANDGTHDGDPQMQTAARIVLDLSSAKFATGSNRGRRIVPYRRLAESDGSEEPERHLYHVGRGADHEVNRAHVLAGQTQPMERVEKGPTEAEPDAAEVRFGAEIPIDIAANMVNTATSTYRLPVPIMEVATERILPFEQVVKHAGVEVYYSHPAYTMSLGGVRRDAALSVLFGAKENANDRGIAMPSNLIPTMRGTLVKQTFQFQGAKTKDERIHNLCGWRGFICGVKPVFADICMVEDQQPNGTTHHYVNSAFPNRPAPNGPPGCVPDFTRIADGVFVPARRPAPHFFLAAKTGRCKDDDFCPEGQTYGIMEMVEVSPETAYSEEAFRQFREDRTAALASWRPSPDGDGTYRTKAGDTIEFRVAENDRDEGHSRLWKVNGVLPYTGPVTDGAVIKQALQRGKASITSPWSGARIDIDFTDWRNPRISDVPAPAGGRTQLYRVATDGQVTWHKHWRALGPQAAELPVQGPKNVAKDWDEYVFVTAAIGAPVIYAMDAVGDLFWFRHEGTRDGSDRWRGPIKVGNGWTMFDKIIAGENGVIYGRLPDGRLRWHRHLGHADGSVAWTNAQVVGTGWHGYTDILAGSAGVLYGIRPNGDLIWHRHVGHQTGAVQWIDPARQVGNGWHTLTVRSVGRGVIYVITPGGELRWYRHRGHGDGKFDWAPDLTLDQGWRDFKHIFALNPDD